ncbi:hypothetical protein [Streptomyces sp. NPDC047803]|uniref:hypothetical protein n=1 Tax=unclassified Streptomyces TaxID=2593676 RepID=UPI0033F968E4
MNNPKQRYPRSVARRLPDARCPECGRLAPPQITEMPDLDAAQVDPDVLVIWHCPNSLCEGHDGFFTEEKQ